MNSPDLARAFARSYAEARDKFLAAAARAGAVVESIPHPLRRGAQGEELAVDVALVGNSASTSLLCLLSGTHGVEGYCGSGVQVALLDDASFHAAVAKSGAAALLYHGVNPYGFSHDQRTDEGNVDLNRNFRDFSRPLPRNAAYAEVHGFMVPAMWPPDAGNEAKLQAYVAARGTGALQAAVSGGQCEFPEGLFFGGTRAAWSNDTLRQVLRKLGMPRRRLGWIDIHTGLGPWGHAEKILSGPDDRVLAARARSWWGDDITSFHDGSSASALVTGVNYNAPLEECPQSEYTGIGLEYGTLPLPQTFAALRADNWLQHHADASPALRAAIKQQMRDAFYGDTDEWRGMVYGQARVAVFQALRGLSG